MSLVTLLVILLVIVLLFGGGWWGHRSGWWSGGGRTYQSYGNTTGAPSGVAPGGAYYTAVPIDSPRRRRVGFSLGPLVAILVVLVVIALVFLLVTSTGLHLPRLG